MDRRLGEVAVVFVPGLGLGQESCRPTMRALNSRCLLSTVSGFGEPAPPGSDLSPPALATRLLADLARQRLRGVVLVGHSSSCQVVAEAAASAPDRVVGLVLIGPTTDPSARTWGRMAMRWLATAIHERPWMVPSLARQYARTGLVSMARSMDAARRHDISAALSAVNVPLLVLRGRHDRIARQPWIDHLAEVGRGDARTLPAGAHMIVWTHGTRVAEAMQQVLQPGL